MAVTAEIKVFPGKEMKALDMAEALEGAFIAHQCILQGCEVSLRNGKLNVTSGSVIIKGRVATVTGGEIDEYPSVSSTSSLLLLAVCDLAADTPFYIRLFSPSEYETLVARRDSISDFNGGNGVWFSNWGTATYNPATRQVTRWAPSPDVDIRLQNRQNYERLWNRVTENDSSVRNLITNNVTALNNKISNNVSTINKNANASHTLLTQKINAWSTYLQKREFSSSKFVQEVFTVPSFTIAAGARVACTFPAIRGTTFTATGTNSRTESKKAWTEFTQTYTTLSDGTKVPLNVDDAAVRYVAVGIAQAFLSNAAYQSKGKNANNCVVAGWGLSGLNYDRRGVIYLRNIGSAEAIVDLTVAIMFVRRS
jgi:hypothetical protein